MSRTLLLEFASLFAGGKICTLEFSIENSQGSKTRRSWTGLGGRGRLVWGGGMMGMAKMYGQLGLE